jgi:hypothetical protein
MLSNHSEKEQLLAVYGVVTDKKAFMISFRAFCQKGMPARSPKLPDNPKFYALIGSGNYWECNIAQERQLALSDDVVEFMALQLQKLPVATQTVLKLAACISNQFDLTTLAIVTIALSPLPKNTAISMKTL